MERTKVPIRNELVSQLTRWNGIRENMTRCYYLQSARQNNVFFRPVMNLLAMRAGELRRFHFGSGPELFVDGLAGHRQLGRSGTANK